MPRQGDQAIQQCTSQGESCACTTVHTCSPGPCFVLAFCIDLHTQDVFPKAGYMQRSSRAGFTPSASLEACLELGPSLSHRDSHQEGP